MPKTAKWESRLTTTKRELLKAVNEYGTTAFSVGKPTYCPTEANKVPDLIFFFVIKNISSNYRRIDVCEGLFTDHSAIILTLSEHMSQKENNFVLVNKHTNKPSFKQIHEEQKVIVPLRTAEDLEKEVEKFKKTFKQKIGSALGIIKDAQKAQIDGLQQKDRTQKIVPK